MKKILKILSHSGAIEILKALSKKAMRFYEITNETGLRDGTTGRRLKELQNAGLIHHSPNCLYWITEKGKKVLELIEEFERCLYDKEKEEYGQVRST